MAKIHANFSSQNRKHCSDLRDTTKRRIMSETLKFFIELCNIKLKDRKYCLRTYNHWFLGRYAVQLLISTSHSDSCKVVVHIWRLFSDPLNLFKRIKNKHEIEDISFFYNFKEPAESLGKTSDKDQFGDNFRKEYMMAHKMPFL